MASINNIINVTLLAEGQAAAAGNMNVASIITGNQGVLSSSDRYRLYKSAGAVSSDFGASSSEAAFANVFFDTSPSPISAGGALVMGYWRASDETVAATKATLKGEQLSEAQLIPILNGVTDGSFTLTVDGGVEQDVGSLNFTSVSSFADVVTILDGAVTDATVTESNGSFIVTSDTTGMSSTLTYLGTSTTGTDISTTLGLSSETGAVLTQGADQVVLTAETKLDAVAAIKAAVNIKGAMFIDQILDAEVSGLASWAGSNDVIMYETFSGATYLEKQTTNPVWAVKLAGQSNFRCLYSAAGNRKFAATYMSRTHTVNFAGQNVAITLNLKELAVPAEDYNETDIAKAKTVGLDIYTTTKDTPIVLCSGANDFVDNVYNLLAFVDAIQTNNFNFLKVTPTKVAQTDQGIDAIEDDTEKTCEQFVRAGVFAPGTWTLSDFFGNREQFLDSIATRGYYVLAGDLADQSTADRQSRKSPTIQIAVKNAGAVHSEDIIINFNK